MTDAYDLLMEARWEQEGVRRATERYREAAAKADPSTLPSGQKLLRAVVPPLIEKIIELQLRGGELARNAVGTKWAIPIQLLSAETLAVITTVRALTNAQVPADTSATVTGLALDIAVAVRDELDYRDWVDAQVADNKAAQEARNWDHVDLLAAFKRRYPSADRRSWRRFRRKLEHVRAEPWDRPTQVQLGSALINALVEAAPDRFEVEARRVSDGRTQNYLRLSAETQATLRDVEARAEVTRPMLMPMLIPPLDWRYE